MGGVVVEYEEEDELEPAEETDGENVGYSGDELDDEEEEEEGQDEYEQDGFIVDEVEEEEELEESDVERHERRSKKKKKRDPEENFVLDEEDYELLEDNNITGFRRPKAATNKFKRLKKAGRNIELEEQPGLSNEESIDRSNQDGFSAEEKLKHRLFGYDEVVMLSDDIAEEEAHSEDRSAIGYEDEMADFIVDEDVDEVGDLSTKKRLTKKKSHKLPGISSSALQEAKEIFGDVDELLMLRKQDLVSSASDISCTEKRLEDEFEPFVLSEKYMTLQDVVIRETDVPERIQLSEDITGPPPTDDKNIEEESHWIYDMLTHGSISPLVGYEALQYINIKEIENVLTMMHLQKFDIPFISMYRKELCCSLLKDLEDNMLDREEIKHIKWHKILWAIWTLDKKWLLLQKRLIALRSYYSRCFIEETQRVDDEAIHSFNKIIFQSVISALNNAKSEREVDDIDAKFNMHFPPSEDDTYDGKFKRPKRKSTYSIFRKAGLWEIANKFGANSETFGMLLSLEKISDEVEDTKESPEEVAANYICSMFQTYKDVLNGARYMASVEIAYEPNVKKHVRSIFMKKAVVSTSPTHQGNLQIDAYHQLGGVKWLRNKPLSEFVDAQWLLIQKGEEDKLLKVTIKLPDDVQNKLLSDASDCYLSESVSRSAKSWNDQRKMIFKDSFFTYIFPAMEKEARSSLTTRAKYWLRMEYGRQLWNKVSIAPFQWNGSNSEDEHAARVMACCWGSGKSPTTIVMLDSEGEMVDVLYVNSFSVRSQTVADQERKRNDQHQVLQFMMKHQPHVVCVGAANMACKRLSDDIYEVIFKIVEDHPTEVGRELENISTVFGDETLPCLYENSRVSSDQFPGYPGIVKRAVALGRYMQNPLAMVATLCGPGKEILSWKLHSLDHFLTPDEKYEVVEQIMVDATNQIGLDINLAASHEWIFAPLQFISGLGPRKASSLQRAFLRAGFISNRKEISMGKILKKKVFTNAVGFLRIRRSGAAAATSHVMDLLDDTRIHPESYGLAKNVAKDIYDEDDPNEANVDDDDMLEMVIEHVRENPHMLKLLDINEYAKSIFNSYGTNKKETLCDIKMELLEGFRDCRTPFKEPSDEEKFAMLSGETNDTISEGRIVEVRVCHVLESQIICAFDSGLKGIVSSHDYSDEGFDFTKVHKGDILTCKIQRINTNRHVVYLTSKASDLRNDNYNLHNRDPYYVEGGVSAISKTEVSKSSGLAQNHFTPRMIVHPRFQNLSADEATRHLSDKGPGESIIRPSSKGLSFLTLILKIFDGVYAHKQIIESKKDHGDMTNLLRLGKTLTIDKDTFEDLDEIMDRFVDPLVAHLRRMLGYRKFRKGTRIEVDDLLRAEKIANPKRIVYCFGVSHDHPGTFILSYIRNANPHHEFIGLYPKGFRFRNKDFDDIDRLVHHFQENINKPPLAERPSLPTFAAVVPMKSNTWVASEGSGYTGDSFDSRNTNILGGHPNGRGHDFCMNKRDSQIHANDEANNSRDDEVQNSAGSESSGWKNGGTGGDQCGFNSKGASSGGGWQGGAGSNGDWSEYCTGGGKGAVENGGSVGWGSGGTSGKWGSSSVAPDGDESTLDGRSSSTGNWKGGNANDLSCSGRGRGTGRGRGRWSNADGHGESNNGGRIGRGGRNERGRGGRSWRGGNAGGGVGSKNWGSGFAATSCEKSAEASGSNDGWGGWGGFTNEKSGLGDDWGSKSKEEGGKVVGDWGATSVNGGGGSHVGASSGWGGNSATGNVGSGGGWGGDRTRGRGRGRGRGGWGNAGGRGGSDNGGRIGRGGRNGRGRGGRSWRGGNAGGRSGCGGGGVGSRNWGNDEKSRDWGSGFAAGSCEKSAGASGGDDGWGGDWSCKSKGEGGKVVSDWGATSVNGGGGWGGQTSGGNAGSSGGGWGNKTGEGNAGSSGGWNDGKTTDGSRKDGRGGSGGSQGKADGAWGSKTDGDNSKDGWSRSGATRGEDGGGWAGNKTSDSSSSRGGGGGCWPGNKTSDSSSKGGGGGAGGWDGNKTSDSGKGGGGGGGNKTIHSKGGGGWGGNKTSDSSSKGGGGGGWDGNKTSDSSKGGGGGGGDGGGWGGNKTSDSSSKGGGGGGNGGSWDDNKTIDGSKGGGGNGGGGWCGNKTIDSKGGSGGGWCGDKTIDSKGGGGGGWGGNRTSDSISKGGRGGGGGSWGGNRTSDSSSKGGGGGDGCGWGGNRTSDSGGSKGGGGGCGWI